MTSDEKGVHPWKRGISICRNVLKRAVSLTRAVLQWFNLFFIIFLFGVLLITQSVYADKLNTGFCYGQSTSVCAYYDYTYDASLRERVIPCHSCCCDSPNNPTHYGSICSEFSRAGAGCAPSGWCKDNSDVRNGLVYNCRAGQICDTAKR